MFKTRFAVCLSEKIIMTWYPEYAAVRFFKVGGMDGPPSPQ